MPARKPLVNLPPSAQQLTIKQIETAKAKRRAGASIREIADDMGVSLETVHRYTKGLKPPKPNGGSIQENSPVPQSVPQPNGGETVSVQTPRPSRFTIEVDLDPNLVLVLAGDAARLGYPSTTEYLKTYNLPWVAAHVKAAELLSANSPEHYLQRLETVMKGYVEYQGMLARAQSKVETNVNSSDGSKTRTS